MSLHITAHRQGFAPGLTVITSSADKTEPTGIGVAVLKMKKGETLDTVLMRETAYLLMSGRARVQAGNESAAIERSCLFDESASCLHAAAGTKIFIACESDCEFTVYDTQNGAAFPARIYSAQDVPNEHRGEGQVGNAAYRFVRTIFDTRNAPPEAELVLGEVVTMPGRWSSYPPHHHPHPEIYHYRFTAPQGYGHGELGDDVLKIRHNDTVRIVDGVDHAQCAAPGYGMYYSWVIRHLPGNKYVTPEFTDEHKWTLDPQAAFWQPKEKIRA